MVKPLFHGVCASTVTPFNADGSLALDRMQAHWFSVMKATLNMIGPYVGDPCPPVLPLPTSYRETLANNLRALGYQTK